MKTTHSSKTVHEHRSSRELPARRRGEFDARSIELRVNVEFAAAEQKFELFADSVAHRHQLGSGTGVIAFFEIGFSAKPRPRLPKRKFTDYKPSSRNGRRGHYQQPLKPKSEKKRCDNCKPGLVKCNWQHIRQDNDHGSRNDQPIWTVPESVPVSCGYQSARARTGAVRSETEYGPFSKRTARFHGGVAAAETGRSG